MKEMKGVCVYGGDTYNLSQFSKHISVQESGIDLKAKWRSSVTGSLGPKDFCMKSTSLLPATEPRWRSQAGAHLGDGRQGNAVAPFAMGSVDQPVERLIATGFFRRNENQKVHPRH